MKRKRRRTVKIEFKVRKRLEFQIFGYAYAPKIIFSPNFLELYGKCETFLANSISSHFVANGCIPTPKKLLRVKQGLSKNPSAPTFNILSTIVFSGTVVYFPNLFQP